MNYRLSLLLLLVMTLLLAACTGGETPTATSAPTVEPTATDEAAATDEITATDEAAATDEITTTDEAAATDGAAGSQALAANPAATGTASSPSQAAGTDETGIRVLDPPVAIEEYTLTSQANEPITLSDLQGRYVLLSFGYTHCPDICPITLGDFKRVKQVLGEASAQVHLVFISVDGARDTPERLNEYLGMFDSEFIGMTGTEAEVRAVAERYGATFIIENAGGLRDEYPVQHTAGSFLMDPEGRWIRAYAYGTAPKVIATDIQALLAG